jgi:Domain of unknown function (DUF4157)
MLLLSSGQPRVDRLEHAESQERDTRTRARLPDERARPALAPEERVASALGNQAFSVLAREGAGILPDGRAHPDVEAVIGRTRGGGGGLRSDAREHFGAQLGDSLADVRVHTDETADALARAVSARAFTTGSDVYFARGEYRPGSNDGNRLLAHELTHVVQQRGAPTSGPLVVSQPGEPLEAEADRSADELLG